MPRTLLITGGTGALGAALVERALADPDLGELVLLVRPGRAAAVAPVAGRGARLRLVEGDLRAGPDLGLTRAVRDVLAAQVTDVLHAGASTSFTAPLEAVRAVNVGGTAAVLEFAARCPRLRRLGCLSTVYVAGRRTGEFGEADVGDPAVGFVNPYEQSKHEMEALVRDAARRVPVTVYRLSTVAGDSHTGEVARFAALHHSVRLLYQGLVPMVPGDGDTPVDLLPLDFAADAVWWLFREAFTPGRTHHVCAGPAAAPLDALLDSALATFEQHRPAWRRRAVERPAFADRRTYELFVRSVEETGNPLLGQATHAVSSFAWQLAYPKTFRSVATEALLAEAGLRAPDVLEYFPRVVRYCVETNWGRAAA